MRELWVCSFGGLEGTGVEEWVCLRSGEHCFFAAAAVAAGFVEAVSTGLGQWRDAAAVADRYPLPSAAVS